METKPILIYDFDISLYGDEIKMKGYCNGVVVVLPDHSKFKVAFYDPVRLAQDLKDEGYIAEPGLIVIQDVTNENIERAVYELWLGGYFEELKPIE
jgi:hypothetical protein